MESLAEQRGHTPLRAERMKVNKKSNCTLVYGATSLTKHIEGGGGGSDGVSLTSKPALLHLR